MLLKLILGWLGAVLPVRQRMNLLHLLLIRRTDERIVLAEQGLQLRLRRRCLTHHRSLYIDLSDKRSALRIEPVRLLLEELALVGHLRLFVAQLLQRRVAVRLLGVHLSAIERDTVQDAVSKWPLADQVQLVLAVQKLVLLVDHVVNYAE